MDTKLKDLIINEVSEEKLKELEDTNAIPPNELFVTEDEDEGEALNKTNITVLWENTRANVYEDFNPQTITLASADYDYLIALWQPTANNTNLMSTMTEKGKGFFFNWAWKAAEIYTREIFWTSDTALTCGVGNKNGTTDNIYCVPYKILGIKLN